MSARRMSLLLLAGASIGCYLGFRMPEESRNRALKLFREGLEMPFRLFV